MNRKTCPQYGPQKPRKTILEIAYNCTGGFIEGFYKLLREG